MIKNSTLKAFIGSFFIIGATATVTAGFCTNWFSGTSEKSTSISSVTDSSLLESSISESSSVSEESISSVEESTSGSSASSSEQEASSGSSEEISSTTEDPTARTSFDSIADWESYYNSTFFDSNSKYYQEFNQIMTDVESEAHLTAEEFNNKVNNDLLACNFIGVNFTNVYKDDDVVFIQNATDNMYVFIIDETHALSFAKDVNGYKDFYVGSTQGDDLITTTSDIHWSMAKSLFAGGNKVNDLQYQAKDFSLANLNGTIIKSNYTYNGSSYSKIGFAANLKINFENESFQFTQAQMDEINGLLTAKALTLSDHQLAHITII